MSAQNKTSIHRKLRARTAFQQVAVIGGLASALLTGCGPAEELEEALPVASTTQAIIGGRNADEGEYPFAASLRFLGTPFCGGTLVARNWVLTAAHCVEGLDPADLTTVIGRTRQSSSAGETHAIAEIRVHPRRNLGKHDVALVRLATPSTRAPIEVASPYVAAERALWNPGATATVIGWGHTREGGSPSDILQEVEVPVLSDATAVTPQVYGTRFSSTLEIAAGPLSGGRDSCQGDSGGPIMVRGATGFKQFGVVSWGDGCARMNKPGVYSRISDEALYPFVKSVIYGDGSSDDGQRIDPNGDGRADVCARGSDGILCALSTGTSLGTARLFSTNFSDALAWAQPQYYATIRFPDVNGDGRTDVCGRGSSGVICALSNGAGFGASTLMQPSFSDAASWNLPQYYSTLRFPDINGDGKADVCARGINGILCALSNGAGFGPLTVAEASFSDGNGWANVQYYSTIRFPDINGDGKADVCGRGDRGVYCGLSNGAGFGTATLVAPSFSDANNWNQPQYYSTLRFPDVNGDSKADVCGRGDRGVYCGLSNGTGFGSLSLVEANFSDANGWNQPQYYSTLRFSDVNGDYKADLCGRGDRGVYCAMSNGAGFGSATLVMSDFSDANGWNSGPHYYSTIGLADLNRDGRVDVCGRGRGGVICALSNGPGFGAHSLFEGSFSDFNGWTNPQYYSTLRLSR